MPASALRITLGLIFLAAGLGKALDIRGFESAVAFLLGIRATSIVPNALATGVVAWEVFLGVALLAALGRRGTAWAVVGTLVMFTAALVLLHVKPGAPGCGCLSLLQLAERVEGSLPAALARNAAMMWVACYLATRANTRGGARERPTVGLTVRTGRGFTVVELLVVIAVTALLVAMAASAMLGARRGADDVRALSDLRQAYAALDSYAADARGAMPYLGVEGQPTHPLWFAGVTLESSYFWGHATYWASPVVAGGYLALREVVEWPRWQSEHPAIADRIVASRCYLAHAAYALPGYWAGDAPPDGTAWFRGGRAGETSFPALKGLLIDADSGVFARHRITGLVSGVEAMVCFADGSATRFDALAPESLARQVERPFGALNYAPMSTREGMRGRDR